MLELRVLEVTRPRVDSEEFLLSSSLASLEAQPNLSGASRWAILTCLLFVVALFYVFTYNSGYGYDALEYLVLGRALAHGQLFYSLVPSKSPGIYLVVAAFLSGGLPASHYTVSALITMFFAATLVGTWLAVRSVLGYRIALISTLLVAACSAFMEMNFLEPESAVYLSGLAAFVLVLRSVRTGKLLPLFAAGFFLAVGFQFKSVAAFYLVGICCFLFFKQLRNQHVEFSKLLRLGSVLAAGFFTGGFIPLLFFATTGRLSEFWTWTVAFPLFHYPSNTFWLSKLFTKLLWFHLLVIVAFFCSVFVVRVRRTIWSNDAASLAFFMALVSYLALLKTQSSHYCFPGAAFFSVFISAVLLTFWKTKTSGIALPRGITFAVPAVLLALTLSALLYEPKVFSRFMEWRSLEEEERLGSQVRQLAAGSKGLFVRNGSLLHWVSGVEPAWRFVFFDVQTTYFVEQNPDSLLNVLNDESTSIIEFNPADPGFEDVRFGDSPNRSRLLVEFTRQLEKQFRPADVSPTPYHFWVRKTVTER